MAHVADSTARPRVSVILPTRDRLELLRRAVESVRVQTEQSFELIVVDDVSADGTSAYLTELAAREGRVRVLRNGRPTGGAGARNEGIRISRGEWVAFIDDDDEWMPRKLEKQLRMLSAQPAAVACSCNFLVRSPSGATREVAVRANATVQELLAHNWLGGASACVCVKDALRAIGGFDARLRAAQDLDLWVRLRQRGAIAVCAEPLLMHRAHAGPRITTDPHSQYQGGRRFYLKHRHIMSAATRRHRLAHSCYAMSMQNTRRLRRRLRLLEVALFNSSPRYALAYVRRSLPLLIRDARHQLLTRRSEQAVDTTACRQEDR